MLHKIESFFRTSTRLKINILFFFAIIVYSWLAYTTIRVGSDDLRQLEASINFIHGYGFSILSIGESGSIITHKLLAWPYIYRILAVPFLLLTNLNIELSFILLLISSFAFLIYSIQFFIKNISLPYTITIRASFLFFSPFLIVPFKAMGASDMIALACLIISVAYFIVFFNNKGVNNKAIFLFFIFLSILPHIRYAYVPLSMSGILLYCITIFYNKNRFHKIHLVYILIVGTSLFFILTNEYFVSTSDRYVLSSTTKTAEDTFFWLKPFYAPFFNAFVPDYIIVSFGQKFTSLWLTIAPYVFLCMSICSFIIMGMLMYYYISNSRNFASLWKKEKLIETGLFVIIFSTLLFYVIIYRNHSYTYNEIISSKILYKNLSVVNRYFAPIYLSTLILALIYSIKKQSKFFAYLLIILCLFSVTHFIYMRTIYHPYSRDINMTIVNKPPGSYADSKKIGTIIKENRKDNLVYVINDVENVKANCRQITPILFARANGAIASHFKNTENISIRNKQEWYYITFADKEINNSKWKLAYKGSIYSLYKSK
ncbi:MAG: hypothetical protein ACOCWG_00480 [bacterium]